MEPPEVDESERLEQLALQARDLNLRAKALLKEAEQLSQWLRNIIEERERDEN